MDMCSHLGLKRAKQTVVLLGVPGTLERALTQWQLQTGALARSRLNGVAKEADYDAEATPYPASAHLHGKSAVATPPAAHKGPLGT